MIDVAKQIIEISGVKWYIQIIQIVFSHENGASAFVEYVAYEGNVIVDSKRLTYEGEAYNNWYANFENMKFLEQELAAHLNLNIEVKTKESDYLNTI